MPLAAAVLPLVPLSAPARAEPSHAVILQYHRFGEDKLPSTNIRLAQFESHLAELTSGSYRVVPLKRVIDAFKNGTALPDRTIAITVDDAYKSVYTEAWPRLKAAGFPFTVFVSTNQVGRSANYLNWEEIREMSAAGVGIGHHGAAHGHMSALPQGMREADLNRAETNYLNHLGGVPDIFAYPYGEADLALQAELKKRGLRAALGQHSGVAFSGGDDYYLPRFAMNETYGGLDRFKLAVNALPIAVSEISPEDMTLGANPPAFGFSLIDPVRGIGRLNCFASHLSQPLHIERLGDSRFEVRFDKPFPPGRSRINCTMRDSSGRWRWLGRQFYVPKG